LSKEIILGHPCVPCAGLTRVAIRTTLRTRGGAGGGELCWEGKGELKA